MVDMTETTPGVPLRSPLSDVPPFSIYLALSFSLSLSPFFAQAVLSVVSLHPPFCRYRAVTNWYLRNVSAD